MISHCLPCRAIPKIRESINQSSILLLTEICSLIALCFVYTPKTFVEVIAREFRSIQSLISFVNIDLLGKFRFIIKFITSPTCK